MKLFVLIVLVLNIFLKKLKNLLEIKTQKQIFFEYKQHSVMCGCFCKGFIDFMIVGRKLTDYTSLFYPYDFKKNDDIIAIFQKWMKIILFKQLTKQT